MKYMKVLLIMLFSAMMLSCEKNTFGTTERSSPEGKAQIKFGFFSMYPISTSLTVYQNDSKLTASVASPYGYPGGGFNTGGNSYADYLAIDPGNVKFDVAVVYPNINFVQRKVYNTTYTLTANSKYIMLVSDTSEFTTSVLLEDKFPAALDSGYALFRIVNLIPNSGDLDFYKNDSLIATRVSYKKVADLVRLPASLADTFAIRPSGSPGGYASTATAYYRLSTNTNKRIYTMVARGYLGATIPRNPTISFIINK